MKRTLLAAAAALLVSAGSGCGVMTPVPWPGADTTDDSFARFCASPNPLSWFAEEFPVDGQYHWGHGALPESCDDENCNCRCNCQHPHGVVNIPGVNPVGSPAGMGGAVDYPYYTTRAPRDFLQNNPPSIGP